MLLARLQKEFHQIIDNLIYSREISIMDGDIYKYWSTYLYFICLV